MTITSCDRENFGYEESKGYLRLSLDVDNKTDGATTRAVDNVPSAADFAVAIYKGSDSNPVSSYDKFSQIDKEIGLAVGQYTVKASYGQLTKEGFDSPYFVGEQSFSIADGDSKDVSISCALANAKVNIIYTDAFKNYFSAYNTEVNSAGNSAVTYSETETRGAYFCPGQVSVYVNVTRQTGTTARLFAKTFTAVAKHEYNITMDIDAGTSTLDISFDDSISNEEDVNINVSDAALSAKAPIINAIGFNSGSALNLGEGIRTTGKVQAYINAESGLKGCIMKTTSAALLAKGWPAEVDLGDLSAADKSTLESFGLTFKGLGANKEKIALVDFTEVIPLIEYNESNPVTTIQLQAVDKNSRTNEGEFSLVINTLETPFSADQDVTVSMGAREIPVNVVFGGDAAKNITAQYKSFGQWTNTTFTVKSVSGNDYVLLVQMPYDVDEDDQIRLINGSRTLYVNISTSDALFSPTVVNEADIWTDSAVISFVYEGSDNTIDSFLSGKTVTLQLLNETSGNWSTLAQSKGNASISLTGLEAGKTYTVRAKATDNGVTSTSKTFKFTTETASQLPNAGFEYWYSVERHNGNWYQYYPWSSSDDTTKGWDTVNQTTFQTEGNYRYNSNSGTISTTDSRSGNAALIRSVGWGNGNTAGGASSYCYNKTPGELYLGSYNTSNMTPDYGMAFTSRPKTVSFYYKYTPNYNDSMTANVVVENRTDGVTTVLATGSFADASSVNSYQLKTITLTYTNTSLKATHLRVEFKSGSDSWSDTRKADSSRWITYPAFANLSNGEFIGSQLYIDDVTLGY
jgi:hypothetical protein